MVTSNSAPMVSICNYIISDSVNWFFPSSLHTMNNNQTGSKRNAPWKNKLLLEGVLELLELVRHLLPRIPFDPVDFPVLKETGKDISGMGNVGFCNFT